MLRYPLDNQSYKAYIRFTAFTPKNANLDAFIPTGTAAFLFGERQSPSDTRGALARIVGSVELYMPAGMTISEGVNIENVSLGLSKTIAQSLATEGGVGNTVAADTFATAQAGGAAAVTGRVDDFISKMKDWITPDDATTAAAAASGMLPTSFSDVIQASSRKIYNPNTQALFRGVNTRSFSFAWKFIPTSEQEADQINQIISYFRSELYPEALGDAGDFAISFRYPNLFRINFLYDGREMLNVPKIVEDGCFLESISTNFNPSSMAFFREGSFSEIDFTLNFVEVRPLKKSDVS